MKPLGIVPALTVFTFLYALIVLLVVKEATNIFKSIDIVKKFNEKTNEVSNNEQSVDREIKEEIGSIENKTIKSSELQAIVGDIFNKVANKFSKNDTRVTYVFSINSIKVSNETYMMRVKYKIDITVVEQYFYISSETEGEKDVIVNLLEDSSQT
ncbi:hypothetical protein JHC27_04575 [archaeon]|jgi:hypothetical protein|nr:hypothetical protein [archaeon]